MAESGEQALVSVSRSVCVAMVLFIPSYSHEYTVGLLGYALWSYLFVKLPRWAVLQGYRF